MPRECHKSGTPYLSPADSSPLVFPPFPFNGRVLRVRTRGEDEIFSYRSRGFAATSLLKSAPAKRAFYELLTYSILLFFADEAGNRRMNRRRSRTPPRVSINGAIFAYDFPSPAENAAYRR